MKSEGKLGKKTCMEISEVQDSEKLDKDSERHPGNALL